MSTRNIKKHREMLLKNQPKEPPVLEDFEPHFSKNSSFSTYAGLEVSSGESDHEQEQSSEHEEVILPVKGKKKNNKKKNKKNKQKAKQEIVEESKEETDEIDEVVAEVNRILGEPPPAVVEVVEKRGPSLLAVNYKYLNVEIELNRLFGPDEDQEQRRRRQRNQRGMRIQQRCIVERKPEFKYFFRGLSMTPVNDGQGDVKTFKYEHSREYVNYMYKTLEDLWPKYYMDVRSNIHEIHILNDETVEASLENNDFLFEMDATSVACRGLEDLLCFMETTFHPKFNLSNEQVELPYEYVENRTLHVLLLKYLHVLTNKACHRTALELAKVLLNLDKKDPLAVIFIIDTLALRAREHKWLVDLYYYWENSRDAKLLFNMRYSYALARFHVAHKMKDEEELEEADQCLRDCIVQFPFFVRKLVVGTNLASLGNKALYVGCETKTPENMKLLIQFYVKFANAKWREPVVWQWFGKNATAIAESYDNDPAVKTKANDFGEKNMWLYPIIPLEIRRHINTITPMAELLMDGELLTVQRTLSFNPYPRSETCIDKHSYYRNWSVRPHQNM